jgi:hypothetical protein
VSAPGSRMKRCRLRYAAMRVDVRTGSDQLFMIRAGRISSNEIGGTAREKLTKRISRCLIQRGGIERCFHILQPGPSSFGANREAHMRFAQAQVSSMLSLHFFSVQELNEKSGERFDRTPEVVPWEERAKSWVLANARVKCCGQPPATFFTTKCFA